MIRREIHKEVELPLDLSQNAIKTHINKAVCLHQQHFEEGDNLQSYSNDSDSDHDCFDVVNPAPQHFSVASDLEWQKPLLVTGKPGWQISNNLKHS